MPDITMCFGESTEIKDNRIIRSGKCVCPLSEKCYRFKANAGYYQAYADFTNSLNEDKTECEHFMEIWKK